MYTSSGKNSSAPTALSVLFVKRLLMILQPLTPCLRQRRSLSL